MRGRAYPTPIFDDAHDEQARKKIEQERLREEMRQKVRASFPEVTEFADTIRAQFPGARLVWAVEKQNAIGKVPADVRKQQEEQFGPLVEIGKG